MSATWSIIVYDRRTKEIVVSSFTCVPGHDLLGWTPMLDRELGVAVTQGYSWPDTKILVRDRMARGHSPERIVQGILKRYGQQGSAGFVVAMIDNQGRFEQFIGERDPLDPDFHITQGEDGDFLYLLQGGGLTGKAVIEEAERTFLSAPGDLSQRVMAAMETARSLGGDGRCSCRPIDPTGCGTPPPNFSQSATIGYLLVSRPGDPALTECLETGCVPLDSYLVLNEPWHQMGDPDPVDLIRAQYDAWRIQQRGIPDAGQSILIADTNSVRADIPEVIDYWVDLYDLDGAGITHGGATFELTHLQKSIGSSDLTNVIDHQDGSYTLQVQTGSHPGLDHFAFRVQDGSGKSVQLWPELRLLHKGLPPAVTSVGRAVDPAGINGSFDAQIISHSDALWMIPRNGSGDSMGLHRATRTSHLDRFEPPAAVQIDGVRPSDLRSFWISKDELFAVISIKTAEGGEELLEINRPDLQSPFGSIKRLGMLNVAARQSFPSLTDDRLNMLYTTWESGAPEVRHATRLNIDAAWFPSSALPNLSLSGPASRGQFLQNLSLCAFKVKNTSKPSFLLAQRNPNGLWEEQGPLAGTHELKSRDGKIIGWDPQRSTAWILYENRPRKDQIMQADLITQSLTTATRKVSATSGAAITFELQAPPSFAGSPYEVIVGGKGSGMRMENGILPLKPTHATQSLRYAVSAGLQPTMSGNLNSTGSATANLVVAPNQKMAASLIGLDIHFCFVSKLTSSGYSTDFISNAVSVSITL
ncbi:MAG: DUF1028 domain-containing protein [Planctomycetes bacterium]|nr:DUF1028 domain-containing protein [Planctomycetota bacterium]